MKLQHLKGSRIKGCSDLLQLTPYFSINTKIFYTHTCTHTHTHTCICIGAFFCCRLQQMAVSLGTIGIEAIFTLIYSVASLPSCNILNEPKNT